MYTAKDFKALLGTPGFSDTLLNNHFALYEGYVKNVNALDKELADLEIEGGANGPDFNEQKRRYGWEYNGMYLHELYFGNLVSGGAEFDPTGALVAELDEQFGSVELWKKEFIATGSMRGIGWALLVRDAQGKLKNIWVNEHDSGLLAGATPLVVMDVFEHAFMIDYGLKRADYIAAFFAAIDWKAVEARFAK